LNVDGSILCSTGIIEEDKTISAIASSLWTSYYKTGKHISDKRGLKGLLIDCEVLIFFLNFQKGRKNLHQKSYKQCKKIDLK
jgi:hypothetical protein